MRGLKNDLKIEISRVLKVGTWDSGGSCFDHHKNFIIIFNLVLPFINRNNPWDNIDASSQFLLNYKA